MTATTLTPVANEPLAIQTATQLNLRGMTKSLLSGIVLVSIAGTAWKLNQQYNLTSAMLSTAFACSAVLAIVYRLVNPVGWTLVLRGLGQSVPVIPATRIWLHAESRRWLPGGVWGYASRAVQARELGVPVGVASASMLIELLAVLAAAVVVSVIGVALYWQQLAATVQKLMAEAGISRHYLLAAVAAIPVLAVTIYAMRSKLQKKLASVSEKVTALQGIKPQVRPLFLAFGYLIAMACLNGLVNVSLVGATSDTANVPVIAMIAATATAWAIGFLAIFSPGGIIVREAALAAILLPWLPYETGFTLALLSRFAQLTAEVVGMLLVMTKRNMG